MILNDFIPPIFRRWRRGTESQLALYPSYAEALADCAGYGYEQEDLLNVIFTKTKLFRDSIRMKKQLPWNTVMLQSALAFSLSVRSSEIRVLDFGGACGGHYLLAKSVLPDQTRFSWNVVETESMTRKAQNLENAELKFFSRIHPAISQLNSADLTFCSGALQYVEDPYGILNELVDFRAANLCLIRLPLTHSDKEMVLIQQSKWSENGPGAMPSGMTDGIARIPLTISSKDKIEKILLRNYKIRFAFPAEDLSELQGHRVATYAYYCELR